MSVQGTRPFHTTKENIMSYVINCEDGITVKGDTMDELLDNAEQHVRDHHADLVGTLGREELRAMAVAV